MKPANIVQHFSLCFIILIAIALATLPNSTSQAEGAANWLDVVFSEVAWSGMPADYNDEWIELYNNTGLDIDLAGWRLFTAGTPDVSLSGIIPAGGHYLLERTDDTSIPDHTADQIYTGALSNSPGEVITLTDNLSNVVDVVGLDPSGEWFAGTSSPERLPMVRVALTAAGTISTSWATGVLSGTPINSIVDADADTYGYSPNFDWTAGDGAGYELRDEDCDDGNDAVFPGAVEVLNLVDDDCDGQVDEGLDLGPFEYGLYFNSDIVIDALDKTTATVPMELALIDFIDTATGTIDAAIYGFDRQSIAYALIDAHNRGVRVRVVGDNEAAGGYYSPTYNLVANAGITVVLDTSTGRLEHNKFAVFDEQIVWTGSTNWTGPGFTYNANNSVVITSPNLALAYSKEFEEMYGGAFQTFKQDNTTHTFSFTTALVESYFSPTDDVQAQVTRVLSNAQESIHFALFYWTTDEMADLVVSKVVTEGLAVSGVWDAVGARNQYSEDEKLCAAGVPLKVENFGGKVHDKFAIIDVNGENPVVVTGSYNWTAAGTEDNDENTLIIYDADVALAYYQEYVRLYDAIPDQAICGHHSPESGLAACQDGSDNDFDGYVDEADLDCRESTPETCQDGIDNDNDGDVDLADLDCYRCRLVGVQIVGDDLVAAGESLTLTGAISPTDPVGPFTYSWSQGHRLSAVTTTAVYSWPEPGVYGVAFTVTNQCRFVSDAFTVTVRADPAVGFSSSAYSVDEGEGAATITVTLDAAPLVSATVEYATADGTALAGSDYLSSSGILTFAAGTTHRTFSLPILDDALEEANETVTLLITNPVNAVLGDVYSATLTILDDDGVPVVSFEAGQYIIDEVEESATISVVLDGASPLTVSVNYATVEGTAAAGEDYAPVTGTLAFEPGVTRQTFTVPITADGIDEDDETVGLVLSGAAGATIGGDNPSELVIVDGDAPPGLSIADASLVEGDSGLSEAVFNVTLSLESGKRITVGYATADDSAISPDDYIAVPTATLVFSPGLTTRLVTVNIQGDTLDESDEVFWVNLVDPINAVLDDAQGQGTIIDDDGQPSVRFSAVDYAVGEAVGSVTISVTLSNPYSLTVAVDYATSGGTATPGEDYAPVSDTLTFDPGVTHQTFVIPIVDDGLVESDETIGLALSNPVNADLGTPEFATLSILDNDVEEAHHIYLPVLRKGPSF